MRLACRRRCHASRLSPQASPCQRALANGGTSPVRRRARGKSEGPLWTGVCLPMGLWGIPAVSAYGRRA
eukprot:8121464-Alexandrium_andersonii.AAC.1